MYDVNILDAPFLQVCNKRMYYNNHTNADSFPVCKTLNIHGDHLMTANMNPA